jgi:hypothetical protein
LTKRLAFLPSKSAAGGWCTPWANAMGKAGVKRIMAVKNATTIKRRQEFLYSQLEAFFRSQNCSMVYIGYFCEHATPNTINIDPLN